MYSVYVYIKTKLSIELTHLLYLSLCALVIL